MGALPFPRRRDHGVNRRTRAARPLTAAGETESLGAMRAAVRLGCAAAVLSVAATWDRSAAALPETGQRYELAARLDPERNEVHARGSIAWRNESRRSVQELYFHLYPNAFDHPRTVFMREGGASIRGGKLTRRGGIDLLRLSLRDATPVDLLPEADTALVANDATQMRVPLPRVVAPGETIELEVEFRVRLPSLLARMGEAGGFFMIAQWFPKLARLEPDGRWASFPYHGLGEFYADFADYDLTIEVPERFVIAAAGHRVEHRVLPSGVRRERYVLRHALDVAFAAAPALRRVSARAGRVQVDAYAPPGHAALALRQADVIRGALARLEPRLGDYPYDRLVLVLPPPRARGAAGMEYPGLLLGWTAGATTHIDPVARALHDFVTAHELAHQWFPLLVASDEVEHPVLDEGLAEWLAFDLVRARYGSGTPLSRILGAPLDPFELARIAFHRAGKTPSSLLPARAYRPPQLGPAVYLRPALVLESVARTWGSARLYDALGRYARAHRFAHPNLTDLWNAFDAAYHQGFSEQVLRPALQGAPLTTRIPARHDLLARRAAATGPANADSPPLLSRLLLWTQTALGVLGP
jgi:hypothetical protein